MTWFELRGAGIEVADRLEAELICGWWCLSEKGGYCGARMAVAGGAATRRVWEGFNGSPLPGGGMTAVPVEPTPPFIMAVSILGPRPLRSTRGKNSLSAGH